MSIVVKDWKYISCKSYSAWAFYILAALTVAPDIIFKTTGRDTNPALWSMLILATIIFGLIGRLLEQPEKNKWARRAIVIGLALVIAGASLPAMASAQDAEHCDEASQFNAIAFDLISKWEGENKSGALHQSYRDIVGVWTICYGHTRTAAPNQFKTDSQCRDLLIEEITEYREGLHGYFNSQTKLYRLPATRDAAYTSLAYNVGIRAAGRSTATRRLNAGDIKGGCAALAWWNRAGGRVVRGLANRRAEEVKLCLIRA